MAASVRLIRRTVRPDGVEDYVFANSISGEEGRAWGDRQATLDAISNMISGNGGFCIFGLESIDGIIAMLMTYWKARSADLSNINIVINKDLTVDFSAANPIRLQ